MVCGGRIISIGINKDKTILETSVRIKNNKFFSVHAEVNAMKKTKRSLKDSVLYVARINPSGKPLLSKPCATCEAYIINVGIKKIVYTG